MHRISHGFLGKFKTYTIPVPVVEEQTIEQRKVALLEKTKSWVFDPSKLVRVNGYVPQDTPPPVETFNLTTQDNLSLLTESGDFIDIDFT